MTHKKSIFSLNQPLFRLHGHGFVFAPKILTTIGTILLVTLFIKLAIWQMHRADYKKQLIHTMQSRQTQAPLTLAMLTEQKNIHIEPILKEKSRSATLASLGSVDLTKYAYYPIQLKGHYDNRHHILIDNRIHHHRAGYYVLTPFIPVTNPQKILLVNRGWVLRLKNRENLPTIKPVTGLQTITGFIKFPEKKVFLLKKDTHLNHWPLLLQGIQWTQIKKALKAPIYPFMIWLYPKDKSGFVRQWHFITMPPERHLAYAVQWLALALTLVIIYGVLNIHREESHDAHKKPR